MNTAAMVAKRKEVKPHLYCPESRCLWQTRDRNTPVDEKRVSCPRHSVLRAEELQLEAIGRIIGASK